MFWNRLNPQSKKAKRSLGSLQREQFNFKGHEVVLERRAHRRNISLYLYPDKPIKILASLSTDKAKILSFLLEKQTWIERHQAKFSEISKKYPPKKILQNEKFPFLGTDLELKFQITPLKKAFFSRTQSSLNLHLPEKIWHRASEEDLKKYAVDLKMFYKKEAIHLITERMKIWTESMQAFPKTLKFRNPKTRWGSCSSKGVISINWRLIGAPLEVIDYILIHEISHLKHLNHSKNFWSLVETFDPNYKSAEKWLDEHHRHLDFLLP